MHEIDSESHEHLRYGSFDTDLSMLIADNFVTEETASEACAVGTQEQGHTMLEWNGKKYPIRQL